MIYPVDGSIIVYNTGGLAAYAIARGYLHTAEHIISQPYRYPSCRRAKPIVHSQWLACIQRNAPIIPRKRVLAIYSPWTLLRATRLPRAILRLVEELSPDLAGVTGSYAVGCQGPGSDVDLVIYSTEPLETAAALRKLREKGDLKQCALNRVAAKRGDRQDYSASERHIRASRVESCYRGVPFTLRLLRAPSGRPCEAAQPMRAYAGRATLTVALYPSDPDSIMVPSRYVARVVDARGGIVGRGDEIIIESFRTRYADLEKGVYVVRGDLFLDRGDTITLSPDLWGGVWRLK